LIEVTFTNTLLLETVSFDNMVADATNKLQKQLN